jgi:S-adenosylmethionine hydrolase
MPLISLLTDFGTRDEFVGVMKAVLLGIAPRATIVDLTHHIAPHDIVQAASLLQSSIDYFPAGTVHLAVVDPGVGGARRAVALRTDRALFVAPDNGLLGFLVGRTRIREAVSLENEAFFGPSCSHTFHGRDVFAPVAGHLAGGVALSAMGPAIEPASLVRCELEKPFVTEDAIHGCVTRVDHFGNLISNIGAAHFAGRVQEDEVPVFSIGQQIISGIRSSYDSVPFGAPLAIIGSRGMVEIAVHCGRADRFFSAGSGTSLSLTFKNTQRHDHEDR